MVASSVMGRGRSPVACDGLSWLRRLTSACVSLTGLGSGPGSLDEELGVAGCVFGYAADMSALENRSAGRLQLSVLRGRRWSSPGLEDT